MGERSALPRLCIAVNPNDLERCKWCGGVIGKDRVRLERLGGKKVGTFCSEICSDANETSSLFAPCLFIFNVLFSILLVISGYFIETVSLIVIYNLLGICYLKGYIRGRDAASLIPRNSRKNEILNDALLLQAMTNYVECPRCHSGLEFNQEGDDKFYHCDNCDASGIIEISLVEE